MSVWDDSGYDDSWGGGGPSKGGGGGGGYAPPGDENPQGAGSDPFDYTEGSLLTPWRGKFAYAGGSGGSGVPDFKAFDYGDFSYGASRPAGFGEVYQDPGNRVSANYQSLPDFKGVTDADMKADKGYDVRMKAGQRALEASKAAKGVLKTGGTAKALVKYGQEMGSQEYGNVYGRKASEHDRAAGENRFSYGTNEQKDAANWDRNVSNARAGYQTRQGAWKDNAAVELEGSRHGYEVATGAYDRNYSKARQGYDDERSHAASVAAAGAAGANRDYNRALEEYTMSRDEFWTNQDRQYRVLDNEDRKGRDASYRYADSSAENAYQAGNARASGTVAGGNARSSAYSNIGQGASDYLMYRSEVADGREPNRPGLGGRSSGGVAPRGAAPGGYSSRYQSYEAQR